MRQIQSISARLVIAISAVAAGSAAVLGILAITLQQRSTDLALQREMTVQYESIVAAIEATSDAELASDARFGWPAWQMARSNTDEHYREHIAQIEAWLRSRTA